MTLSYYEKRTKAKEEIAEAISDHLKSQFLGKPVFVLRNHSAAIRNESKSLVRSILRRFDLENTFHVTWEVRFDFRDDEQNVPRVANFHISVDGT